MTIFNGTPGNDSFEGGNGNDSATGGDGDDRLYGHDGNDTIDGGAGNDTLMGDYVGSSSGLGGSDLIHGGAGDDSIFGGYALDVIHADDGNDWVFGGGNIYGDAGNDYIIGFGAESQSTTLSGGSGNDTITTQYYIHSHTITLDGGDGDDNLVGGDGIDVLVGGAGNDTLYGGDGDTISGGAGNDLLGGVLGMAGGTGDDTYVVGMADSFVELAGEGTDAVWAQGDYTLGANVEQLVLTDYYDTRGTGNDLANLLTGNDGNNTLLGGKGDDTLNGAGGNDYLNGGEGSDSLAGGAGNDSYELGLGDVISEAPGGGMDTVLIGLNYVLGDGLENVVLLGTAVSATGNIMYNTLTGNGQGNTLDGGEGNDSLVGMGGNDTLSGGTGDDLLLAAAPLGNYQSPYYDGYVAPLLDRAAEADTLMGGDGNDTLSAGYGDSVDGGAGVDTLFISFQSAASGVVLDLTLTSQTIGGGTISDVEAVGWIEGSEYADVITDSSSGGYYGGYDPIFGMGGDDNLIAGNQTGYLFGGAGMDTVDGRGSSLLQRVDGGDGDDVLYTGNYSSATAYGGDGNDAIYASGFIYGGAGNDTIVLGSSYYSSEVHGNDGNDDVSASGSGQPLYGDAGDDILRGGSSNDRLIGGAGNDTLSGGADLGSNPNYDGDPVGDTAVYTGKSSDYQVSEDAVTHLVTLVDLRPDAPDGADVLDHTVERVQFSDGTYLLVNVVAGVGLGITNFSGGTGADSFSGSEDSNTATGNGGNDTLYGNGGADILEGDAGADRLDGGSGNDTLYSAGALGSYQPPYYGATYIAPLLDRRTEIDSLIGGNGSDLISAGYGDNIDGGRGSDVLFISFQGASAGVTFDMTLASQVIGGGTIKNIEGAGWIEGSQFGDTITDGSTDGYAPFGEVFGMGGDDSLLAGYYTSHLFGGDGNDTVDGRGSQYLQRVDGGAGNDVLYSENNPNATADGGAGNDTIHALGNSFGGAGDDKIIIGYYYYGSPVAHGDEGDDDIDASASFSGILYGDAGNDYLRGGSAGGFLYGGDGDDTLNGGYGSDLLDGQGGKDVIAGSFGDDTVVVSVAAPKSIDGGDGGDVLRVTVSGVSLVGCAITGVEGLEINIGGDITGPVTATVSQVNGFDRISGTGSIYLGVTDAGIVDLASRVVAVAPSFIYASDFGNKITSGDGVDYLYGGSANDTLNGQGGNDLLDGRGGVDVLTGGAGDDSYVVDNAGDMVTEAANMGTDLVLSAISYVLGANVENLTLTGTDNNNGTGNGLANGIVGNTGDNVLNGGAGADTMTGSDGNDVYSVENTGDVVTEWLDEGVDTVKTSLANYSLSGNVENLILVGTGNSNGTGNTLNNFMIGTGANNNLVGGAGDDTLSGGAGDDLLNGGTGGDRLIGGLGNDTYQLGVLDTIIEQANAGIDTVLSSLAVYTLGATLENVSLIGSALNANGNGLDNGMTGNGLNNLLQGGDGRDTINGMAGDDTINGGTGADVLSGGVGNDVFLYRALADSPSSRRDLISDFGAGDKIDLRQIDADTVTGGDQAFHQVVAFGHHAGELVLSYDAVAQRTLLTVDVNGDAVSDLFVYMTGSHTSAVDWLL